jgi:NADPH-dependent 2,4-dienoyl-CoA reductase/sulfur reductase-like enzyme
MSLFYSFYTFCCSKLSLSLSHSQDGKNIITREFGRSLSHRTLVGSGLKSKEQLRHPLPSLIGSHLAHIPENIKSFSPDSSSVMTASGRQITYDVLVVAAGLKVNYDAIPGLNEGLADNQSGVSTIYSYSTCDKVWSDIDALRSGRALFTQPAGIIKCAGGE